MEGGEPVRLADGILKDRVVPHQSDAVTVTALAAWLALPMRHGHLLVVNQG